MSVYASEMTALRKSQDYLAMSGFKGYLGRTGAENRLVMDLMKRTGASRIEVDSGYARIEVNKAMPPIPHFNSIRQKAVSNHSRAKIEDLHNGFVIRNIFRGSEFVSLRDLSNLLGKRTKLEYSLNCADSECYKDIVDRIAQKIGLANATA